MNMFEDFLWLFLSLFGITCVMVIVIVGIALLMDRKPFEEEGIMPWKKIPAPIGKWGLIALCVVAVLSYLRFVPPESPWGPRRIVGAVMPEPREIVRIEKVTIPGPT